MTEKKRYYRTNVNLEDNNHEPYYNIRDRKKGGNNVLFMVGGKHTSKEIVDRLNEQEERIKELETEQNKVQEVLTDYFNRYTQMAVELRHDKYGNGVCHDVTEVIMEIADKLDINIIDDGDVK